MKDERNNVDRIADKNVKVIIPFRDRGVDPRRAANLDVVMAWWWAHGFTPTVVDDGLEGDAQFNRHRAYNLAVSRNPDADVFVFTEADMLIPATQIMAAVEVAAYDVGLVVPFTQYRYLSDRVTETIRDLFSGDTRVLAEWITKGCAFQYEPESTMDNGRSIGAINVVSRRTLDLTGGYTEATSGNWYDDNIIAEGWGFLAAPTRYVDGSAVHLYHLPGWKGDHLTDADRTATQRNKGILSMMRKDIRARNYTSVHALMSTRKEVRP